MTRNILGTILAAGFLASPALAQSAATWNGLSDRFQIDTGYYRMDAATILRLNGSGIGGSAIDFERDLGVGPEVDTFWLEASWRVGRRHQLKLAYTKLDRERDAHTITRDFQFGGQTFNAGLSANATSGADILAGYYRFAAYRSDRFEIGPTVGIGNLWVRAGIEATGTVTGPGGQQTSRSLDESASTSSITGALGVYSNVWATRRLVFHGDFLYIKVNPENSDASLTDWRLGANYHFFRNAGLGVQYKYNNYNYDREILSTALGGEITYQGFQGFLSFSF
jgi:hypothetical protein